MQCLLDHSVKAFPVIPQSATPSEALAISGQHRLAVIVDEDGFPVALVVRGDLKSAEEQGVGSLADRAARLPPSVLTLSVSFPYFSWIADSVPSSTFLPLNIMKMKSHIFSAVFIS